VIRSLVAIPGIGEITATALYASIGNIHLFESGLHLASWLGITPRESSSGSKRRLGRISKQGDPYLRTLLIHGARSALTAAQTRRSQGRPLTMPWWRDSSPPKTRTAAAWPRCLTASKPPSC
jgi:transposase